MDFVSWLFSSEPSLWIIALGIGAGLTVALAPQVQNIRLAHIFFGLAWFWSLGCTIEEIMLSKMSLRSSLMLAFVACGLIGTTAVLAHFWVEKNHAYVPPPPLPLPPTEPAEAPTIDTDRLARELAERLRTHHPPAAPRAHLHITKFEWSVPADEGGHAEVKVIFENNGNSPTTKFLSYQHAGFYPLVDQGRDKQLVFEKGFYSSEPTAIPAQLNASDNQIPAGVDRSIIIKSSPWTQSAIDSFREGKAVIYVSGALEYADLHATHKTTFCAYTGADGNMMFCQKHNEEP